MVKIVSLLMILIFGCSKDKIQKIYYNGIVWTGDDIAPMVTAIAVTDEYIIAVGDDEKILSMADQETDKINLLGKFVSPGFIDNHVHFISGGLQLSRVNLNDANTKEIFQERLVKFDKILPNGAWILGGNWDHELWGGQYPDKSWIDEVIYERPVLIDRLDGHMALANSKALDIAGINSNTMDPVGCIILKDKNNEPTGILKELAINLVSELVPELSIDELRQASVEGWGGRGQGKFMQRFDSNKNMSRSTFIIELPRGKSLGDIAVRAQPGEMSMRGQAKRPSELLALIPPKYIKAIVDRRGSEPVLRILK